MVKRTSTIAMVSLLVALAPLVATATAKDGDVRRENFCTGNNSAKLKLSREGGRIETEFELDQNRAGVTWKVVLRRNGAVAVRTKATTRGPSGSFEIRRVLADSKGPDSISARAVSPSGAVCTVHAGI